jgi:hypothetical protein
MNAVLLVTLYALAPPLLLWRYYRLAGHGVWWDVVLAANFAVNAAAAGHFAWDEWVKFEPGHWAYGWGERLGPTALIVTILMALILALKPWPRLAAPRRGPRRRKSGAARREPIVSAASKGDET